MLMTRITAISLDKYLCELQTYSQFPHLFPLKKIPPECHLSAPQDT